MNPLLLTDFYKVHHHRMYPEGTTMIYSNFTPRRSRVKGIDHVVFFGLQHFIKRYLVEAFDVYFFKKHYRGIGVDEALKKTIIDEYKRQIPVDTKHIEDLWDLGYLPVEIKALPEGTKVPIGVPCITIKNTHAKFAWLPNYLETLLSCMIWQASTSATIANAYKKLLSKYSLETTGSTDFVQWQAHDFSMRGMSSVESAILSGMGHLLSFTGTDTIPAIYQLESSYNATGLIGASVPATEHSIQCMHYEESDGNENVYLDRILSQYPTGIASVVSDGFNLWKMITETVAGRKKEIMERDGKLVIRPDSGDPVDILCGDGYVKEDYIRGRDNDSPVNKGVIELLWDIFGGTMIQGNDGNYYKVLDSHIGAIYGDSITLDRAEAICERLKSKGFASTNVVLGVGSFTYQFNTRDTFGFAMKATYGEILKHKDDIIKCKAIYKDPITDDGTKKSKKGLLMVYKSDNGLKVRDQQTWTQEGQGELKTVFFNGKLLKETSLQEIRDRIALG